MLEVHVKIGLESTTKYGLLKFWLLSRLSQVLGLTGCFFFIKVYPTSGEYLIVFLSVVFFNSLKCRWGKIYCKVVIYLDD